MLQSTPTTGPGAGLGGLATPTGPPSLTKPRTVDTSSTFASFQKAAKEKADR